VRRRARWPARSGAPSPRDSRRRRRAWPSAARTWSRRPAGSLRPGRDSATAHQSKARQSQATAHQVVRGTLQHFQVLQAQRRRQSAPATSFASSCCDFAPCAARACASVTQALCHCIDSLPGPLLPSNTCRPAAAVLGAGRRCRAAAAPAAGLPAHQWPPPPAAWRACRRRQPRREPRSRGAGGSTPAPWEPSGPERRPRRGSAAAACPRRPPVARPAARRAMQACLSLHLRAGRCWPCSCPRTRRRSPTLLCLVHRANAPVTTYSRIDTLPGTCLDSLAALGFSS